jgi:GT2 family glycosyltransferase
MKASIIISVYNNLKDLQLLLPSITRQKLCGHDMEVIIRDDGSSDSAYSWLKKNYPRATALRGENVGFSKSNNIAVSHATGDVLVFVNADTILDPLFVAAGLELLDSETGTGGVNCSMIMPWVMGKQDFIKGCRPACAYGYFLTSYGFADYQQVEKTRQDAFFLSGGGCFVRRKALENENPFSENLWGATAYCEDLDLSLRLMAKGWHLRFEPGAIVYHNQRPVTGAGGRELRKFLRVSVNRITVYAVNLNLAAFFKFFPYLLYGVSKKVAALNLPQKWKKSAIVASAAFLPAFFLLIPYWMYQNLSSRHKRAQINNLLFFRKAMQ